MKELGERLLAVRNWTIRIVVALLSFLILYVIMVSFVSTKPFKQKGAVLVVKHINGLMVMSEIRTMKGFIDGQTINYDNRVYEKNNPSNFILLGGASFSSVSGDFRVATYSILPEVVKGSWCAKVTYSWWPTMSQREFDMTVDDICFETTEYD